MAAEPRNLMPVRPGTEHLHPRFLSHGAYLPPRRWAVTVVPQQFREPGRKALPKVLRGGAGADHARIVRIATRRSSMNALSPFFPPRST
eukprot:5668762-Pyramimonas_sp.AAC.1